MNKAAQPSAAYRLMEEADTRGELKAFLQGEGPYHLRSKDKPNDYEFALTGGVYKYYRDHPASGIDKRYETTLREMLRGGVPELLVAFDYIRMQIVYESHDGAPFHLQDETYAALRAAVLARESALRQCKECPTSYYPLQDNAYGYITRMHAYTQTKYGRSIL